MPATCPAGHQSESTDYCDTCGAPIEAAPAGTAAPDPAEGTAQLPAVGAGVAGTCPNCGAPRSADDVFCEVCGLDYATGQLPAAPPPSPDPAAADPAAAGGAGAAGAAATDEWVAVVEADRNYFDTNQAETPDAAVEFPAGAGAREVPLTVSEILVGRRSDSRGIFPDIDLSSPVADPGVSRRHAVLRRQPDGGWVVIDQGSTNGTTVRGATTPIKEGEAVRLHDGDHFHVGAWTRITVRKTPAPAPAPSP
jgi:pSer/pThr/pTyr-binding forkhead associated (FHA) protein